MTDAENPRQPSPRVAWIDIVGVAGLISLTAGAGLVWGVGWALLTFGATLGMVYLFTEMLLPLRRSDDRKKR